MIKKHIAIFASGSGTNAENIVRFFLGTSLADVKIILTNKPDAGVIQRAERLNIQCVIFNREEFYEGDKILKLLKSNNIDLIVLAGFLWLVPTNLLNTYQQKIINIHPALLPKYGGKGMYGSKVHQAVLESSDVESGITIHFANEKYDAGDIIFQAKCTIDPGETAESLANKIHELEYRHFPEVIARVIKTL